jgi:hypothetical protein
VCGIEHFRYYLFAKVQYFCAKYGRRHIPCFVFVHCSILVFPTFRKIPANVTVQAGEIAKLVCAVHGEPQPEIAWQKDGGNDFPAARERRMHVMPTDDAFFIMKVKPSDMGIYSCTAHNAAGTIVANASLTVQGKPATVVLFSTQAAALQGFNIYLFGRELLITLKHPTDSR